MDRGGEMRIVVVVDVRCKAGRQRGVVRVGARGAARHDGERFAPDGGRGPHDAFDPRMPARADGDARDVEDRVPCGARHPVRERAPIRRLDGRDEIGSNAALRDHGTKLVWIFRIPR